MHKKNNWKSKIYPYFHELIRIYRNFLELCHLPTNSGFVALDDDSFRFMELKGFPSLIEQSKSNLNKKALQDFKQFGVSNDIKYVANLSESNLKKSILKILEGLPSESKAYYIRQFNLFEAEKQMKASSSARALKEDLKLNKEQTRDLAVLLLMAGLKGYWNLKKPNINKPTKVNRKHILKTSLSLIYDTVSQLTHKRPLKELIEEARKGNDDSLFKAIQINKTLFDLDWVRKRIRKAQFSGEADFFQSLAEAIGKDPLAHDIEYGELILILISFWKLGLCRLENNELMDLLEASGLRIQEDPETFRTFVNRLKKNNILTD
ncbi:MAG: hypothetical protein HYS21_00010 [Deltaproteobacteria bacterium]|nr:hypothetical protein [Deltaproteobacteria bacterium]